MIPFLIKFFRPYRGQIGLTFILLAAVLVMPFENRTERAFTADCMNYSEDYLGIIEQEEASVSIPGILSHASLTSDSFYFQKGTYTITFSLKAESEGGTVDVYDPLYLNPDNTSGRVLASASVPTDGELIHLPFSVEDHLERIQFRVHAHGALEFYSMYLLSGPGLYRDPYIYAVLILLISALILLARTRRRFRPEALILLGFGAAWACTPLLFPWILDGHDLFFHYGRLCNLSEDILSGTLPVRIHPRMFSGFGYQNCVFYAEFFLYPFALLGAFGLSPIGCYRLLLAAVNFATAGVSYYAFSRLLRSRKIGLISSFFYTLSMYRMINLYTRAAVGEVLAMVFLPLLLLGMYELLLGDSRKWLLSVFAFTGLLQSHMITTELAIGFSAVFALCCIPKLREGKRLARLLLAAVSTFLLNLWFILPFLDHMRYPLQVLRDSRRLAGYSLYAPQFFDAGVLNPTGDTLGRGSIAQEMPFSLGFILLVGSLLFLAVCFRKNQRLPKFHLRLGKCCLALGILCVYASSIYFPWDRIQNSPFLLRLTGSIQFAFRFLPFATLFLCIVSAIGVYGFFTAGDSKKLLFLLCGIWCVYSSGAYFSSYANTALHFVDWNSQMDRSQDCDFLYLISDPDEDYSTTAFRQRDTAFLPSEGVVLEECSREGAGAYFLYRKTGDTQEGYVDVSLNYYPCYQAYDTQGERLETEMGELLRLRILLPDVTAGSVTVRYETPVLYRIGDGISLLTALFLLVLAVLSRKKGALHGH